MLLPRRVAGRTLGLRGPDLARGPEVARLFEFSSNVFPPLYSVFTFLVFALARFNPYVHATSMCR